MKAQFKVIKINLNGTTVLAGASTQRQTVTFELVPGTDPKPAIAVQSGSGFPVVIRDPALFTTYALGQVYEFDLSKPVAP